MNTEQVGASQTPGDLYSYLNLLAQQTQKQIQDNKNVEANQQVALAIENTKVAREKDWKKPLEEIEKVAEDKINELTAITKALQDNDQEAIGKLEIKKYVDSLTYDYAPKLSVQPKTVVAGSLDHDVTLTFKGTFPYGASKGYEPSLTVNGKTYKVRQEEGCKGTTDTLEFRIKASDIIAESRAHVPFKLDIPWDNASTFSWSSDKRVAQYDLSLQTLPTTPGKIIAVCQTKAGEKIQEPYTSQTIKFQAQKLDKEWVTYKTHLQPNPGYQFVPSTFTVRPQGTWLGKHDQEPALSIKENRIDVTMKLGADSGANLGRAEFIIQGLEERTLKEVKRKEEIELSFGQNYALEVREGEELVKVKIFSFDGQKIELDAKNSEHSLVKLVVNEGKYTLEATKPEALSS